MRHLSKLMMILSSSIISLTSCYESALDIPAEGLRGDKVHAQMYVSLNYDDAIFTGKANVSNRRFIIEARDAENTENLIERKEIIYNPTATVEEGFERIPIVLELDQKKYVVSVWMDYIEKGTDKDFYYNTEDLSKISMITPESTADVHHDALTATQTIDLTEKALGEEFAVNAQLLNRIAKWCLIANDWKNLFADKNETAKTAIINVAYNSGVAKGFNLYTTSTANVQEGIFIESPINVPASEENTKITLAEDYFFTSQATEIIDLTVNVKSSTGDIWYTQNDISLVCNAGEELKSESNYLTGKEAIKDPAKFEGEGTLQNPYLIGSADNLNTLMTLINEGNKDYEYQTAYYKQTADIDASSITSGLSIGNDEYPFKGTYDGNGKTISKNQGLFGVIEDATIKGVKLINSVANTDAKKKTTGFICNSSKGNSTIENCGCDMAATVDTKSVIFGSLCGEITSGTTNINGCRVIGKADGGSVFKNTNQNTAVNMGGFIGKIGSGATANIKDSYFTNNKNTFASNKQEGNCVGGFCGLNDGTLIIERCYVIAKIQSGGATAFGGIIVGKGEATVSECYAKSKEIYASGNANTNWSKNNTDDSVIVFANDVWPNWNIDASTAWGNMGSFDEKAPIYPTLKWEN